MPAVSIIVLGQANVQRAIDRRSAPQLTRTAGLGIQASGRIAVPVIAGEAPVYTGAMRDSVRVEGEGTMVRVHPTAEHSIYPTRGTRRGVEANPWVRRGAKKVQAAVRVAFTHTVRTGVR